MRQGLVSGAQAAIGAILIGLLGASEFLDPLVVVAAGAAVGVAGAFLAVARFVPPPPSRPPRPTRADRVTDMYVTGQIDVEEFEVLVGAELERDQRLRQATERFDSAPAGSRRSP